MFLMHIFFLVRCMWAVPDPSSVILSHHKCSSTSNMEQVVILTLCGKDTSQGLSLLHRVLTEGEWSSAMFLRAQPVQGLELEVAVNKQNTVSNNHSLHTLMKENISEYVSELFLSPPPPLKKKIMFKVTHNMRDSSCLVWSVCPHWLDFRLRNWVHTRLESSCVTTAWTIWCPVLPWCVGLDGWMLLLRWGSCYHTITPATSVSWCHPHLKWLSDKPPSSSLSMRWSLVGLLSAI